MPAPGPCPINLKPRCGTSAPRALPLSQFADPPLTPRNNLSRFKQNRPPVGNISFSSSAATPEQTTTAGQPPYCPLQARLPPLKSCVTTIPSFTSSTASWEEAVSIQLRDDAGIVRNDTRPAATAGPGNAHTSAPRRIETPASIRAPRSDRLLDARPIACRTPTC